MTNYQSQQVIWQGAPSWSIWEPSPAGDSTICSGEFRECIWFIQCRERGANDICFLRYPCTSGMKIQKSMGQKICRPWRRSALWQDFTYLSIRKCDYCSSISQLSVCGDQMFQVKLRGASSDAWPGFAIDTQEDLALFCREMEQACNTVAKG